MNKQTEVRAKVLRYLAENSVPGAERFTTTYALIYAAYIQGTRQEPLRPLLDRVGPVSPRDEAWMRAIWGPGGQNRPLAPIVRSMGVHEIRGPVRWVTGARITW